MKKSKLLAVLAVVMALAMLFASCTQAPAATTAPATTNATNTPATTVEATTAAATAAVAAATLYALPPAAAPVLVDGLTYYTVGDVYYQPVVQGGSTVYVQVPPPF